MARKKKHEEHENLERWLVSYADFITLLFAFFVVMYSVSAVNQGKYRVLSDALVASFRSPFKSINPIQVGEPAKSIYNPKVSFMNAPSAFNIPRLVRRTLEGNDQEGKKHAGEGGKGVGVEGRGIEGLHVAEPDLEGKQRGVSSTEGEIAEGFQQLFPPLPDIRPNTETSAEQATKGGDAVELRGGEIGLPESLQQAKARQGIQSIAEEVSKALKPLISDGLVKVRRDDTAMTVEIEMKDNFLFPSGSAKLESKAVPVINRLADILKNFPFPVKVEGFTDSVPINTNVFPSNWELSAVRAASVVHVLSAAGIEPPRLSAVGYGEFRPVADNQSSEGRQQNRRVVMLVEANPAAQEMLMAKLPTVPRSNVFTPEPVTSPPSSEIPAAESGKPSEQKPVTFPDDTEPKQNTVPETGAPEAVPVPKAEQPPAAGKEIAPAVKESPPAKETRQPAAGKAADDTSWRRLDCSTDSRAARVSQRTRGCNRQARAGTRYLPGDRTAGDYRGYGAETRNGAGAIGAGK